MYQSIKKIVKIWFINQPLWVSQMLGHKNLNITLEKYTKYTKYLKVEKTGRKTTFLDDEYFSFAQN